MARDATFLRSVRPGAWGGARICAWRTPESEARLKYATGALWGECRGGFFRLVHPIPHHAAPGENSRPTLPHAAHRAQISVRRRPMHCTSREISPRLQPRSAPGENLHPAPHKRLNEDHVCDPMQTPSTFRYVARDVLGGRRQAVLATRFRGRQQNPLRSTLSCRTL
jgi:hypothetical protein